MRVRALCVLSLMLCPALVSAQSFNVDLGTTFGSPADTFGAGADQPGVWNTLGLGGATLVDLSGTATGVSVNVSSDTDTGNSGSASSDIELLFNDNIFDCVDPDQWSVTFSGLQDGSYVVSLYAPTNTSVSTGDMLVNGQAVSSIPGDSASLILGETYVTVPVDVTAGALDLSGDATSIGDCAGLAGVQLTLIEEPVPALPTSAVMSLLILLLATGGFALARRQLG